MIGGPEDPFERLRSLPIGTPVRLTVDGRHWQGWILPPDALSSPRTVRLKLDSGYNVGVTVSPETVVELLGGEPFGEHAPGPPPAASAATPARPAGPFVRVLTTGGTIASRVDYVTGGVRPVSRAESYAEIYPGLEREGPVEFRSLFEILSEDMTPEHWTRLAQEVVRGFEQGARGIVVAQGTDTLAYTSSALAFQLRKLPGPVVLVGAQRSIDRPSSDGVSNFLAAVRTAHQADLGEVVVAMHHGPSDGRIDLHRGTRVRKMHSTRRDAFRSRNEPPLGSVEEGKVTLREGHIPAHPGPPEAQFGFGAGGSLVWLVPGMTPERLESGCEGARGIILAGTGMGHAPSYLHPWIRSMVQKGVVVGMTTQCLEGEVDPYVYAPARELLRAGVVYLGDMLPETAYVKLLWSLGHSPDPARVRALLTSTVAGEMSERRELSPGESA
jgi:glutamyl-tRNA(Gln) amidotransferase subunit D